MTEDKLIETAIQGHASTRDAIRYAIQQEREACAKLLENGRFLHDEAPAKILAKEAAKAIRARGEK
jgi:hypothetical protein